jgi:hypothetical protein
VSRYVIAILALHVLDQEGRHTSPLSGLDPVEPVLRYEHEAPGEMLHIDIKELGRIARSPLPPINCRDSRTELIRPGLFSGMIHPACVAHQRQASVSKQGIL